MLRAHLEGKLGRVIARALKNPKRDWRSIVREDEDTLTSSVVARLTYLELDTLNRILGQAKALDSRSDKLALSSHPTAIYWPSLAPGTARSGRTYVEPDVVFEAGHQVVLVEVKHRGAQHGGQWRDQLRAARKRHPKAALSFLALGGLGSADQLGAELARDVGPVAHEVQASLFALSWHAVNDAVLEELHDAKSLRLAEVRVLEDIRLSLEDRGVRRPLPFWSLAHVADGHGPLPDRLAWTRAESRPPILEPSPPAQFSWEAGGLLRAWRLR